MSNQTNQELNLDSFVDEESSIGEEDVDYNNGRWSEDEHRRFLEATALYGSKWEKVKEHVQTRSARQIRSHAQKFIIRLSKKKIAYNKTVNILDLPIAFEEYQKLSKKELENILMSKFGNTNKSFDNESKVNNEKKYFLIEKYPRFRELKDMINNKGKNPFDIIGTFLGGEEKENEVKKKLVEGILNENINEESNTKKMEELRKMSEVIQILNKTKTSNKEEKNSIKQVKSSDNQIDPLSIAKTNIYNNQNIQNYFTSVNYNIVNNNLLNILSQYPNNNPYTIQSLLEMYKKKEQTSAELEGMITQAQNDILMRLHNMNTYQNYNMLNYIQNNQMYYPFGFQYYPYQMNNINIYQYPNENKDTNNNKV